jgi:3-hydroxyisobutyrate dehydrogenase
MCRKKKRTGKTVISDVAVASRMKAGFIGLGSLGKTIAKRLISEGVELKVWNRTPEKAAGLDANKVDNPADVTAETDWVFLNLFDSIAVRSVLCGRGGLLEADLNGKTIIDTTTNHFTDVLEFHELVRERGGFYLEAPVLGSVMPASQGALTVLVSGRKETYEGALQYLQKIGKNIFFLEQPGLATKMKLINNLALGSIMATIAETVALGEAVGLDRQKTLEILAAGAGNSMILNAKRDKLIREDFSVHFSSAAIYKDLHYLQDLASTMKIPLFTAGAAKELFGMTYPRGIENLDFSAVYRVIRENQTKK